MEAADADFSRSGYSLTSGRLEKGIGPRYAIDDGVFTTCRCGGLEKPSWSIGGKRTDVELNGIGVVRGATFRVKDVPVLCGSRSSRSPPSPIGATGFLMPRVGYSNRRGFQYEQPFFWNISKSQDATVAVDVETSARVGILGEYRYMLSRAARGAFAGGYWNESFRSAQADEVLSSTTPTGQPPVNRWLALGRVSQPLGERAGLPGRVRRQRRHAAPGDHQLPLDARHRAADAERATHEDARRRHPDVGPAASRRPRRTTTRT